MTIPYRLPDPVPPLELVVFDLAGTVLDHGCVAPVEAFVKAFENAGIPLTVGEARGPMGLSKIDHIRELLRMPRVGTAFSQRHGRAWTEEDVRGLYEAFLPLQTRAAQEHADPIEGLSRVLEAMDERGVAYAATTGYPRAVAQAVLDRASAAGFMPMTTVCADEVSAGRPAPAMILRCMEAAGVSDSTHVVKVGDTIPDIEAARNAGVWSVAVTETSSDFGATKLELDAMDGGLRGKRRDQVGFVLRDAGAHAVVTSIAELPSAMGWTPTGVRP